MDSMDVASFNVDVAMTVLDGSGYADLLSSMDKVIAIARKDPDAVYRVEANPEFEVGAEERTMRQVLSDAASDLGPYQPDLAAELDRALTTLP